MRHTTHLKRFVCLLGGVGDEEETQKLCTELDELSRPRPRVLAALDCQPYPLGMHRIKCMECLGTCHSLEMGWVLNSIKVEQYFKQLPIIDVFSINGKSNVVIYYHVYIHYHL